MANLSPGDTVLCTNTDTPDRHYRYMGNNSLRWYADSAIATSWNPNWNANVKSINCSAYIFGQVLPLVDSNSPSPSPSPSPSNSPSNSLTTPKIGDTVRCMTSATPNNYYRYMGDNTLRLYPNPTIAASWNPEWKTDMKLLDDCSAYTFGDKLTNPKDKSDNLPLILGGSIFVGVIVFVLVLT